MMSYNLQITMTAVEVKKWWGVQVVGHSKDVVKSSRRYMYTWVGKTAGNCIG